MILNCCKKNEVKRSSHFGDILCQRIKQSHWLTEFWGKISRTRLLNYLIWFNHFAVYECLPISKNQHHNLIKHWHFADSILKITFGIPRCTWPNTCKRNGSNKCIYVCQLHTKTQAHISVHFREIADWFCWMTLGMPKHIQLKWLNKSVTLVDAYLHAKKQRHTSTHS